MIVQFVQKERCKQSDAATQFWFISFHRSFVARATGRRACTTKLETSERSERLTVKTVQWAGDC